MDKARILVVEDESLLAEDIQERLKNLGYEVAAVAHSGEEALAGVAAAQPDLVLNGYPPQRKNGRHRYCASRARAIQPARSLSDRRGRHRDPWKRDSNRTA